MKSLSSPLDTASVLLSATVSKVSTCFCETENICIFRSVSNTPLYNKKKKNSNCSMVQDIRHHKAETNGPRLLNKKQFSISVRSVFVRKKHYPGKQFNVLQLYSEEYSMAEFVWDSVVLYVYLQCTFSFMGNRKFMLQRSFLHHPLRVRERTHSSL